MNALFESASNIAIVCAVTIGVVLTIVFALKRLVSASIWQKLLVLGLNCVAGIAIIGLVIDFHYVSNKPVIKEGNYQELDTLGKAISQEAYQDFLDR